MNKAAVGPLISKRDFDKFIQANPQFSKASPSDYASWAQAENEMAGEQRYVDQLPTSKSGENLEGFGLLVNDALEFSRQGPAGDAGAAVGGTVGKVFNAEELGQEAGRRLPEFVIQSLPSVLTGGLAGLAGTAALSGIAAHGERGSVGDTALAATVVPIAGLAGNAINRAVLGNLYKELARRAVPKFVQGTAELTGETAVQSVVQEGVKPLYGRAVLDEGIGGFFTENIVSSIPSIAGEFRARATPGFKSIGELKLKEERIRDFRRREVFKEFVTDVTVPSEAAVEALNKGETLLGEPLIAEEATGRTKAEVVVGGVSESIDPIVAYPKWSAETFMYKLGELEIGSDKDYHGYARKHYGEEFDRDKASLSPFDLKRKWADKFKERRKGNTQAQLKDEPLRIDETDAKAVSDLYDTGVKGRDVTQAIQAAGRIRTIINTIRGELGSLPEITDEVLTNKVEEVEQLRLDLQTDEQRIEAVADALIVNAKQDLMEYAEVPLPKTLEALEASNASKANPLKGQDLPDFGEVDETVKLATKRTNKTDYDLPVEELDNALYKSISMEDPDGGNLVANALTKAEQDYFKYTKKDDLTELANTNETRQQAARRRLLDLLNNPPKSLKEGLSDADPHVVRDTIQEEYYQLLRKSEVSAERRAEDFRPLTNDKAEEFYGQRELDESNKITNEHVQGTSDEQASRFSGELLEKAKGLFEQIKNAIPAQLEYWIRRGIDYHKALAANENTLHKSLARVVELPDTVSVNSTRGELLRLSIEFMRHPQLGVVADGASPRLQKQFLEAMINLDYVKQLFPNVDWIQKRTTPFATPKSSHAQAQRAMVFTRLLLDGVRLDSKIQDFRGDVMRPIKDAPVQMYYTLIGELDGSFSEGVSRLAKQTFSALGYRGDALDGIVKSVESLVGALTIAGVKDVPIVRMKNNEAFGLINVDENGKHYIALDIDNVVKYSGGNLNSAMDLFIDTIVHEAYHIGQAGTGRKDFNFHIKAAFPAIAQAIRTMDAIAEKLPPKIRLAVLEMVSERNFDATEARYISENPREFGAYMSGAFGAAMRKNSAKALLDAIEFTSFDEGILALATQVNELIGIAKKINDATVAPKELVIKIDLIENISKTWNGLYNKLRTARDGVVESKAALKKLGNYFDLSLLGSEPNASDIIQKPIFDKEVANVKNLAEKTYANLRYALAPFVQIAQQEPVLKKGLANILTTYHNWRNAGQEAKLVLTQRWNGQKWVDDVKADWVKDVTAQLQRSDGVISKAARWYNEQNKSNDLTVKTKELSPKSLQEFLDGEGMKLSPKEFNATFTALNAMRLMGVKVRDATIKGVKGRIVHTIAESIMAVDKAITAEGAEQTGNALLQLLERFDTDPQKNTILLQELVKGIPKAQEIVVLTKGLLEDAKVISDRMGAKPVWFTETRMGKFHIKVKDAKGDTSRYSYLTEAEMNKEFFKLQKQGLAPERIISNDNDLVNQDLIAIVENIEAAMEQKILQSGVIPADQIDSVLAASGSVSKTLREQSLGFLVGLQKQRRLAGGREAINMFDNTFNAADATFAAIANGEARRRARLLLRDPSVQAKPDLAQLFEQHTDNLFYKSGHEEKVRGIQQAAWLWYMAGRPVTALVELTQNASTFVPYLVEQFGVTPAGAYRLLGEAASKAWDYDRTGLFKDALTQKVWDEAKRLGFVDNDSMFELDMDLMTRMDTIGSNKSFLDKTSISSKAWNWMMQLARKPQNAVLNFNRRLALLSSIELAKKRGMFNAAEIAQFAIQNDMATQFSGGKINTPVGLMSGRGGFWHSAGGAFYVLKNYMLSYMAMNARMFKNSINKNIPLHERKNATNALATSIGTSMLLTGYMGVPVVSSLVAQTMRSIFQTEPDEVVHDLFKNGLNLPESIANIATMGVASEALGVDLSNLIAPEIRVLDKENQIDLIGLLGPGIGVINDAAQMTKEGGVAYGSPLFVRNQLNAWADGGNVRTRSGDLIAERREYERFLKSVGLTSTRESKLRKKRNALFLSNLRQQKDTADFADTAADAVLSGKTDVAKAKIQDVIKQNPLLEKEAVIQKVATRVVNKTMPKDFRSAGSKWNVEATEKTLNSYGTEGLPTRSAYEEMQKEIQIEALLRGYGIPASAARYNKAVLVDSLLRINKGWSKERASAEADRLLGK